MILTSSSRLKQLRASEEDIHIMILTKGVQIFFFFKSETSELKKPTLTPECLKQPP